MSHSGHAERTTKWPQAKRVSAVFSSPLRMNILSECNEREMSPRSFHREVGGTTLTKVVKAFELLAQYDWLERTRSEDIDSDPAEHRYRGTGVPIVHQETWEELPDSTRALIAGQIFGAIAKRAKHAMKTGTIAARGDAHLTWTALELDRQGWHEAIEQLDAVFYGLGELEQRAKARLAASEEEPIAMTVGLLGFESPRDGPKGS
jgi:hypothetical protein